MESAKKYFRMLLNIIIPLIIILAVVAFGPRLIGFFMPFVIGGIIAMIANPLVRFLESKLKIVRKHSSVIIVILILAIIIGGSYLIIAKLVIEGMALARDLPALYSTVVNEVRNIVVRYNHIFEVLPASVQESVNEITSNFGSYMSLLMQNIAVPTVEVTGNLAKSIPAAMVYSVVTILSAYFFIADNEKIMTWFRKYIPGSKSKYMRFIKNDTKKLIGGYFIAQFKIMFVMASILFVGFLILGVHYSFFLALIIALLDFLPIIGTGTILIPWAVIKLFGGEYAYGIGLIVIYIFTMVIRQIIQPKIVGDTMGLPPLMTLLFLYLGFKVNGIAGMILAVPIGLLVVYLYQYGVFDNMIDNIKMLVHDINEFRKGNTCDKEGTKK